MLGESLNNFLNLFRSFDEEGYDKNGFDRKGFNREGSHRSGTRYGYDGYGVNGYDREGYDRKGFDRDGIHRNGTRYGSDGYDWLGYDRDGYDQHGFDRDGYDRDDYDCDGYHRDGYDRKGYNRDGYNRDGYDRKGYDREGYSRKGYNRKGYDREGYSRDGYDHDGYDRDGFDRDGIHRNGTRYDSDGYDRDGYDSDGYDREGYDRKGFARDGIHRNGTRYGSDGYDRAGLSKGGLTRAGKPWWSQLSITRNQVSDVLYTTPTPVSSRDFQDDPIGKSAYGVLGFMGGDVGKKDVLKRSRDIERLLAVGADPRLDIDVPYCRAFRTPGRVKESAERLLDSRKARLEAFFWFDFDAVEVGVQKELQGLLESGQLRAAHYLLVTSERRKTVSYVRNRALVATLALEHEGTKIARNVALDDWKELLDWDDRDLFDGDAELRRVVLNQLADLFFEVGEEYGDSSCAAYFGKISGCYSERLLSSVVMPFVNGLNDQSKLLRETVERFDRGSASRGAIESDFTRQAEALADKSSGFRKKGLAPEGYHPLEEAVNEFAQVVRNSAISLARLIEDENSPVFGVARRRLKLAADYANQVALKARIEEDLKDLEDIQKEIKESRLRAKQLEDRLKWAKTCADRDDFNGAIKHLRDAQSFADSAEAILQLEMAITNMTKSKLANDFNRQMNSGQFQQALNTLEEAISIETDWQQAQELRQLRDALRSRLNRWW